MMNDDMINDYLDNKKEDEKFLNDKSDDDKMNFNYFKKIDSALHNIKEYQLDNNFNLAVMAKLKKRMAEQRKQKNILLAVIIFLGAICLFLTGLLFTYVLDKTEKASENFLSQNTSNIVDKFTYYFKGIITTSNLNIIAPVLAFIILISAYFFYESRRQSS